MRDIAMRKKPKKLNSGQLIVYKDKTYIFIGYNSEGNWIAEELGFPDNIVIMVENSLYGKKKQNQIIN